MPRYVGGRDRGGGGCGGRGAAGRGGAGTGKARSLFGLWPLFCTYTDGLYSALTQSPGWQTRCGERASGKGGRGQRAPPPPPRAQRTCALPRAPPTAHAHASLPLTRIRSVARGSVGRSPCVRLSRGQAQAATGGPDSTRIWSATRV